jgi:hypothetical protein
MTSHPIIVVQVLVVDPKDVTIARRAKNAEARDIQWMSNSGLLVTGIDPYAEERAASW